MSHQMDIAEFYTCLVPGKGCDIDTNTLQSLGDTSLFELSLIFFLLVALHAPLIALSKLNGAHGTDVGVAVRSLNGNTLLEAKNFTGRRWHSNPGPCR